MLLRSGDLAGFARRLWRRLVALLSVLGRLGGPVGHVQWRERWVDLTDGEREVVAGWASATRFAVVVGDGPPEAVEGTVASLAAQLHDGWVLSASAPDVEAIGTTAGVADWVVELEAGVVLHEAALATVARAINADSDLRLVYADFDHLDGSGVPFDPCFLPDWNPDLFDGLGRIGPLVARHRSMATPQDGAVSALHGGVVAHLPFVLVSRPGHLRAGDPAPVRRRWPVGDPPPRVSVLIPTRDQGRLLETCLTSLRSVTTYPNVEIVVVDHESTEQRARDVIDALDDDPDALVVPFSGPFNFAAMCNRAAEAASGDVLVLLNNDTEVVAPDWLDEFVGQLGRPEVGVVGALLLFSDGTIQHAGVHPGVGGLMGHGHKHWPGDDAGYHGRLTVAHEVAAVTGACLGVTKALWDRLGGLDEENLTVAYNDIDLCLKARAAGLRVVLAPHAVLNHHESVSRGVDDSPKRNHRLAKELSVMQDRWENLLLVDPAYNPNLSFDGGSFTPATQPRLLNSWLDNPVR
jgi:GT2 family glycosyltransferase